MNATAVDHADGPLSTPQPAASRYPDPESRAEAGRLEVADQVVEKVAGHAVTLVSGAAAAPRRLLGINVGQARPMDSASVTAQVEDGIASVQATIAVRWPRSVQAVADEVRRRIRDDVTSLTGVRVDHIDVEVVSMTSATSAPRVR
jgi:uncharacterized alkaline shock family protein YloU